MYDSKIVSFLLCTNVSKKVWTVSFYSGPVVFHPSSHSWSQANLDLHPPLSIIIINIILKDWPFSWWGLSVQQHSHQTSHQNNLCNSILKFWSFSWWEFSSKLSSKNYLCNSILKGGPSSRMRIVGTKLLPARRLACWRQNLKMLIC